MDVNLYKTLPDSDRMLFILGNLIDEKYVKDVLDSDLRQGSRFRALNDSLNKMSFELKRLVLLSLLNPHYS